MRVEYKTSKQARRMIERQKHVVEKAEAALKDEKKILEGLQQVLDEALDREAKGLPTGIVEEE